MIIGITLQLFIDATPRSNMSGITACWWDSTDPSQIASPAGKTVGASTDATGTLSLDLSSVSALSVGAPGFLLSTCPTPNPRKRRWSSPGSLKHRRLSRGCPSATSPNPMHLPRRRLPYIKPCWHRSRPKAPPTTDSRPAPTPLQQLQKQTMPVRVQPQPPCPQWRRKTVR